MSEAFELILEKIEEKRNKYQGLAESSNFDGWKEEDIEYSAKAEMCEELKEIVQEVAEEYSRDMQHNLAEMYAKNMVDYGVDITKVWETATQQSYALEQAYIRGRKYERDKFIELRKEYNNGWIPCSERLPEIRQDCLVTVRYTGFMGMHGFWVKTGHMEAENDWWGDCSGGEVIAWQPLPEPYQPKGE